jgi:hypothetical protein
MRVRVLSISITSTFLAIVSTGGGATFCSVFGVSEQLDRVSMPIVIPIIKEWCFIDLSLQVLGKIEVMYNATVCESVN